VNSRQSRVNTKRRPRCPISDIFRLSRTTRRPPDLKRGTPDTRGAKKSRLATTRSASPSRRIAARPRLSPPASSEQRRADAVSAAACFGSRFPRLAAVPWSRCSPDRSSRDGGANTGRIPAWDRCAAMMENRIGECGQRSGRPPQGIPAHWSQHPPLTGRSGHAHFRQNKLDERDAMSTLFGRRTAMLTAAAGFVAGARSHGHLSSR
jgi:hypothetical protein